MNEVIIKTPQFKGSQDKFDFTVQSGHYDRHTMVFIPNGRYHKGRVGVHKVHFHSDLQFLCYISKEEETPIIEEVLSHFKKLKIWMKKMIISEN